uniref:Putative DNA helicase INO80 n=1 Tax=Anthurium amnicola TaxID=1678845 RepID=A0A1D1XPU2_9ARAE
MGCAGSKLDDLPAVALCRDRSHHLADAIRLRYALADAHAAYLQSLRAVGDSLRSFFDTCDDLLPPPSPVLPLPTQPKGDIMPPLSPSPAAAGVSSSAAPVYHHSSSGPGSHLQFYSSGSELSDEDDGPLHSCDSSPLHHHIDGAGVDYMARGGGFATYINYAKKGPAPSAVSYEQRPFPEVAQVGEPSYYGYPYSTQNAVDYANPYSQPLPYAGDGGMVGSFFGGYTPQPVAPLPPSSAVSPSYPKPTPPPPSPPRASTWDFLNPFEEAFQSYYPPPYTSTRNSKELREEEGIPDLEEEEDEVVKEAYGGQKLRAAASSAIDGEVHSGRPSALSAVDVEDGKGSSGEQPHYHTRPTGGGDPEQASHLVDKNVVADEVQKRELEEVVKRKVVSQSRGASEVVQDIKALFDRASDLCDEVSKMLEVGKHPYRPKKYEVVSSKMISRMVLPVPAPVCLEFNEEKAMKSGNLSSTLYMLYIWEKKLCEEVRAEEKLWVLHDRKCKRLKRLDERGAEAHKVDSIQALVRKLSTKIRIEIQAVDSISDHISRLRDEELWPQLNELIQGFVGMWRAMMECHRRQCQAILESRNLDVIACNGQSYDAHMEATQHLELTLLKWIETFCSWFNAQRNFAKALNGWLSKCVLNEPEVTDDGFAPFSPGRLGAPPIFIICNQWSQVMDNTSGREVVAAMQAFAESVLQLWDKHKLAERQRMMANRDMDRRLRAQEREEQMIDKALDVLNKKLILVSDLNGMSIYGQIVHQKHSSEVNGLQEGLKQIFGAMERFAETSLKIYEDLCVRSEEQRDQ